MHVANNFKEEAHEIFRVNAWLYVIRRLKILIYFNCTCQLDDYMLKNPNFWKKSKFWLHCTSGNCNTL